MPHTRALARLAGRAVAVAVGEAWRGVVVIVTVIR
jgi:hypothetical protein